MLMLVAEGDGSLVMEVGEKIPHQFPPPIRFGEGGVQGPQLAASCLGVRREEDDISRSLMTKAGSWGFGRPTREGVGKGRESILVGMMADCLSCLR